MGEFILPYDAARTAKNPERTLMEFLQSTYDAAADLGKWDRAAPECGLGEADHGQADAERAGEMEVVVS